MLNGAAGSGSRTNCTQPNSARVSTGTELDRRSTHRHAAIPLALADTYRVSVRNNVDHHAPMLATKAKGNLHPVSLPSPGLAPIAPISVRRRCPPGPIMAFSRG